MATYSEPPVVVTGQTMSAANWNAWVVDVAKAMWAYTAAGQMLYSSAANALAALSKPSVDSVLKNTNAGTPSWKALSELLFVASRQGGSTTTWATPGTTNYTPSLQRMEAGAANVSIVGNPAQGSGSVTFATAFPYTPLVFLTYTLNAGSYVWSQTSLYSVGASGFSINFSMNANIGSPTNIVMNWLAIGPA